MMCPLQGDRVWRGEPYDHSERGHRVRPHAAAPRTGDVEHRGPHGVPEPDRGAHTAGVREHFRQVERDAGGRASCFSLSLSQRRALPNPAWPCRTQPGSDRLDSASLHLKL